MRLYFVFILLLLGNISFSAYSNNNHAMAHQDSKSALTQSDAPLYVCPMHPHIHDKEPSSCPICGMDLVIQRAKKMANVKVSGQMQQALAIRTEHVTHRTLWRFIETYAQVQYAEDAIHHSHIRANGWIEQLFVRSLGQSVKAGEKLFSYYAPDLLVAQDDYLQALAVSKQNGEIGASLLERAETRLHLLGLTQEDIDTLKQHRKSQYLITVYAHQDGVVTMLNIRDGMYIQPSDTLIEITNIDKVWLIADVPEYQQNWLKLNMSAEVDIPAHNIHGLETNVDYIYPALDTRSRSAKVRLSLENKKGLLKPNMLLPVRLYGGAHRNVLSISRDAVLISPSGSRVIVKNNEQFSVRHITTGMSAQGYVEVLSGLHENEEIVVSGQFLLDAEASLNQLPTSTPDHAH